MNDDSSPVHTGQSPIPDALAATIQHIELLDRQIAKLTQARREALDQAITTAGRLRLRHGPAKALYERLKQTGLVGRGPIMDALGWNAQRLAVSTTPGPGIHVVYALTLGVDVVYVGRSSNMRARLRTHRKTKRGLFDGHEMFYVDSVDEAKDLEAVLIQQHRPPLNQRVEKRGAA